MIVKKDFPSIDSISPTTSSRAVHSQSARTNFGNLVSPATSGKSSPLPSSPPLRSLIYPERQRSEGPSPLKRLRRDASWQTSNSSSIDAAEVDAQLTQQSDQGYHPTPTTDCLVSTQEDVRTPRPPRTLTFPDSYRNPYSSDSSPSQRSPVKTYSRKKAPLSNEGRGVGGTVVTPALANKDTNTASSSLAMSGSDSIQMVESDAEYSQAQVTWSQLSTQIPDAGPIQTQAAYQSQGYSSQPMAIA